ncbi:unnamed protein product [Pedinophyceae sp. YPF-701]|nr:unnamed protein product [Pedinophyceae sp. YPF-701]
MRCSLGDGVQTAAQGPVASDSAHPAPAAQPAEDPVRVFVGGLPWNVPASEVAAAVRAVLADVPGVRVDVRGFGDAPRRARDADKHHQGTGFVTIPTASARGATAETFAARLHGADLGIPAAPGMLIRAEPAHPPPAPPAPAPSDAASDEERRRMREHKQRQRRRRVEARMALLRAAIEGIPHPGGPDAQERCVRLADALGDETPPIDWARMPSAADPAIDPVAGRALGGHADAGSSGRALGPGGELPLRALRKRWQAESFALALKAMAGEDARARRLRVVDFATGTGNLCLPLAHEFPSWEFLGVEMKPAAVDLFRRRAADAGLANVRGVVGMIEAFEEPFDIALALHACGNATDYALWRAEQARAAFLVCPCCVGKLQFSLAGGSAFSTKHREWQTQDGSQAPQGMSAGRAVEGGASTVTVQGVEVPQIGHPRSAWMRGALGSGAEEAFGAMAKAGDIAHGAAHSDKAGGHAHEDLARLCKTHLELDRLERMREAGYRVSLLRLLRDEQTGKGDLLLGVPERREEDLGLSWPWQGL